MKYLFLLLIANTVFNLVLVQIMKARMRKVDLTRYKAAGLPKGILDQSIRNSTAFSRMIITGAYRGFDDTTISRLGLICRFSGTLQLLIMVIFIFAAVVYTKY